MMIVLIVVFVFYVVFGSVSGRRIASKSKDVTVTDAMRLSFYNRGILESWISAVCLGALSLFAGVRIAELLRFTAANSFQPHKVFMIALWVVAALIFAVMCYQYILYRVSPAARLKAWEQVTGSADASANPKDHAMNLLFPRDARQRRRFFFVSLTAGVCEEFVFRGVAFAICHYLLPDISIYLVPLIPGVIFGIAHIYQGITGVVKTGVTGIILGYIYAATGSLITVIIVHFVIDLQSSYMAPDKDAPETDDSSHNHSSE
jgi:hypothetical protein